MLMKLIETKKLIMDGFNDAQIKRELGISERTMQRRRTLLRVYPYLDHRWDPEELPNWTGSYTSRLRCQQLLGDDIVSPDGTLVDWIPRSTTDKSPWVDDFDRRYNGRQLTYRPRQTRGSRP